MTMIVKDYLVKRSWIIVIFSFGIVTLATSAYLMYRDIYRPKKPNSILASYGYMFREEIDLEILNKILKSPECLPVNRPKNRFNGTGTISCPTNNDLTKPRQKSTHVNQTVLSNDTNTDESNNTDSYDEPRTGSVKEDSRIRYTYHGCCISNQEYKTPGRLEDAKNKGKFLRIVQFKKRRQPFLTDVCTPVKNCDKNCECIQQLISAAALVVDGHPTDKYFDENDDNDYDEMNLRIELVKYPGWCKCFNKS